MLILHRYVPIVVMAVMVCLCIGSTTTTADAVVGNMIDRKEEDEAISDDSSRKGSSSGPSLRGIAATLTVAGVATSTSRTIDKDEDDDNTSYVFLQKFPLQNTFNMIFHTEVLVCKQNQFSKDDQELLNTKIESMVDFDSIEKEFWSTETKSNIKCVEYGYGGAACTERCCAVPHEPSKQLLYSFNDTTAIIHNADTSQKSLYIYGTSKLDSSKAWEELCSLQNPNPCWSNWAGIDYNPLSNNCNTFTSTVLHCIYGLSENKPNLGPSDTVTVTCDKCPSSNSSDDQPTTNVQTTKPLTYL